MIPFRRIVTIASIVLGAFAGWWLTPSPTTSAGETAMLLAMISGACIGLFARAVLAIVLWWVESWRRPAPNFPDIVLMSAAISSLAPLTELLDKRCEQPEL